MTLRANFEKDSPDAIKALMAMEMALRTLPIDRTLLDLVNLKSSQINRCAYCIDLHTAQARAAGETDRRLAAVIAWRDTPFFTARERAALAWAEALTLVHQQHISDELYEEVSAHFDAKQLIDLSVAVATINTWNKFGIAFRKLPKI